MDSITEIKKAMKDKKAVIGTDEAVRNLKLGKLEKLYVTVNCPKTVVEDLSRYCMLAKCKMEVLEVPNDELGVLCKKPFAISVLGLLA